jgi:6-phosphogluconolactonase (cycloisomerase 2 family)
MKNERTAAESASADSWLPPELRTSDPSARVAFLVGLLALGSFSCGGSNDVRPPQSPSPTPQDPCATSATAPVSFVYAANSEENSVSGFTLRSDGHLCPIAGFPVATGRYPIAMAVDPSKRFLYVVNLGSDDITSYAIGSQGTLTRLASAATGDSPTAVDVHPSGSYLYATHTGGGSGLWAYRIGTAGDLTPFADSPVDVGNPNAVQVHPSGRFLYVAALRTVAAFAIGAQGELTSVTGSPFAADNAASLAMDPLGRFLFVPVQDFSPSRKDAVWVFSVGSDGALTQVAKFPLADVDSPTDAVIDPSGRFLYIAAHRGARILGLAIDSTGALSAVPGSPFGVGSQLIQPMSVAVDPSGRFVCTVDRVGNSVHSYEIGPNGSLTRADSSATGLYPQAVVITLH